MLKLEIFLLIALLTLARSSVAQDDDDDAATDAADDDETENADEDGEAVEGEASETDEVGEETEEEASDEAKISCFSCNATDDCNLEQHKDNGTTLQCEISQHCWTMKTEKEDEETYKRYCGEECTDESKELDCRSSNNQTECHKCCSEAFCNDGLLGGARKLRGPMFSLLVVFVTYQIILC